MPDCIDDYISDSNSARVIEAYINSLDLVELGCTRQDPNAAGRPMYDQKDLFAKSGLIPRCKFARLPRLETESGRNLELIWLLRTLCPDHKTIAEFRRQNGEALKKLFKGFVKLCVKLGLYGKELLVIDGSKFKAVNSKERNYTEGKLKKQGLRCRRFYANFFHICILMNKRRGAVPLFWFRAAEQICKL
jgi:transposase